MATGNCTMLSGTTDFLSHARCCTAKCLGVRPFMHASGASSYRQHICLPPPPCKTLHVLATRRPASTHRAGREQAAAAAAGAMPCRGFLTSRACSADTHYRPQLHVVSSSRSTSLACSCLRKDDSDASSRGSWPLASTGNMDSGTSSTSMLNSSTSSTSTSSVSSTSSSSTSSSTSSASNAIENSSEPLDDHRPNIIVALRLAHSQPLQELFSATHKRLEDHLVGPGPGQQGQQGQPGQQGSPIGARLDVTRPAKAHITLMALRNLQDDDRDTICAKLQELGHRLCKQGLLSPLNLQVTGHGREGWGVFEQQDKQSLYLKVQPGPEWQRLCDIAAVVRDVLKDFIHPECHPFYPHITVATVFWEPVTGGAAAVNAVTEPAVGQQDLVHIAASTVAPGRECSEDAHAPGSEQALPPAGALLPGVPSGGEVMISVEVGEVLLCRGKKPNDDDGFYCRLYCVSLCDGQCTPSPGSTV